MEKKSCYICGKDKVLTKEFYKNKSKSDGHDHVCKICRRGLKKQYYYSHHVDVRQRENQRRRDNRELWLPVLEQKFGSLSCSKCGFSGNFAAIDCHHIGSEDKEFNFGHVFILKPTPKRIEELDKCVLLCANCHRIMHYLDGTLGRRLNVP